MEYAFIITIVGCFVGSFYMLDRQLKLQSKREVEMFREFVRAVKSQDLQSYNESLPSDGKLPIEDSDELVDALDADPNELLKALKNGN